MMKVLMDSTGKAFYVKDPEKDYHCQYGVITKEDLKKALVKTNTGKDLFCFDGSFIDSYKKIKRGAQIIPRKDIGFILTETGIGKKSKVLDAGGGSGALTLILANFVKEVICYEIREDFYKIVKKNIDFLGFKNIKLHLKDIYEGISEKNLDLITLDLPEPWKVIPHAKKALKQGGFLISYSPTVPQVSDFIEAIGENFVHLRTIEIIEREWEVVGRKVRPRSQQIGHSGFLSLCRKIQKS